ncbi:hypothetical protein [Leifsonia sp. NPDC058248]|uniref:hypothetical protein n=1 Tax=Leifsonia sp. NPDC058248 TaxID=3346402 RepID=UPI0036DA2D87
MSLANDRRWELLDSAGPILTAEFGARGVIATRFVGAFPDLPGAGVWLCTTTDRERDTLRNDATVVETALEVLREVGFSPIDVARSAVIVESQQTVDQDFEGSWYYAMR